MMLATAAGKAGAHTVTDWSKRYDAADDGTLATQLRAMLAECGLATLEGYSATYPYIARVSYQLLPAANRWVTNKEFSHWIVRLSDSSYHDPYWPGVQGANKIADKAILDKAEIAPVERTGLVVKLNEAPLVERKTRLFLRLRSSPTDAIGANILGDVAKGAAVKPLEAQADAAGRGRWLRVAMPVPNMVRDENVTVPLTLDGWIAEWLTDPVTPVVTPPTPPPSPPPAGGKFRIGLNVLQDTTNQARGEAVAGCRSFLVMDSFALASNLAATYPEALVMARRYWKPGRVPRTPDQAINGWGDQAGLEGANDPNLIYTLTNEADQYPQGLPDLAERAKFELATARAIRAKHPTARVAVGSFSVGTPDFTNPKECEAIKALYAPAYNAGEIWFDMHLYAPNIAHFKKKEEHIWFITRWKWLFTHCGFDPSIRHIVAGEGGMDEGEHGGFVSRNMTNEAFAENIDLFIAAQTEDFVVNGVAYPSPVAAVNCYQLSDPRWASYSMQNYLPDLRKRY